MIVNRLDKTQVERQVNLQGLYLWWLNHAISHCCLAEREARDAEERREKKHMLQQQVLPRVMSYDRLALNHKEHQAQLPTMEGTARSLSLSILLQSVLPYAISKTKN